MPKSLLATKRRVVRTPEAAEMMPALHHLATVLDEVRDTVVLYASPREERFPSEVLPEKSDALGLDGLELIKVGATGQKASLGQVLEDLATLHPAAFLVCVQPELGLATFDGGNDVNGIHGQIPFWAYIARILMATKLSP